MTNGIQTPAFSIERFEWKRQVLADRSLTRSTRHLAGYLCDFFVNKKTGQCWPGNKTLAECLGVSKRTVQRGLRELEQASYLKRVRSPKARRVYQIDLPGVWNENGRGDHDRLSPSRVTKRSREHVRTVTPHNKNQKRNKNTSAGAHCGALRFIEVDRREHSAIASWTSWLAEDSPFDQATVFGLVETERGYLFPSRFPNKADLVHNKLFFETVMESSGRCLK